MLAMICTVKSSVERLVVLNKVYNTEYKHSLWWQNNYIAHFFFARIACKGSSTDNSEIIKGNAGDI